jgi:hypothetical protein
MAQNSKTTLACFRARGEAAPPESFVKKSFLGCLFLIAAALPVFGASDLDLSRPDPDGTPTKVRIGLYIADIQQVSASDQTILADVIVQAEWQDPRLAKRWPTVHGMALNEVWNPRLILVNQRSVAPLFPDRVEVEPSGLVRWRQRWLGRFSSRMDLRDFPMDRQNFQIQLVSIGYTRSDVDLVTNAETPRSGRAPNYSITDWNMSPVTLVAADFEPAPGEKTLSGAALAWGGRRYVRYYAFQIVTPLALIVLIGWTAVWIDPAVITARVSIAMTAMLTLIFHRFSLASQTPSLTYLTRLDYFLGASIGLVFCMSMIIALDAWLFAGNRLDLVKRIDRWVRVLFPTAFCATFLLAWWL